MRYLLDTDTCVYWINNRGGVKAKAEAFESGALAVSVISLAELYFGVENSQRIENNRWRVDELVAGVIVIQATVNVAKQYGKLRAYLKIQGTPVADMDLLIASTALVHQLPLVTNNTRHYQNIFGLSLENWLN